MKVASRILRALVSAFVIVGAFVEGDTVEETVKIVEDWKANNKAACSAYTIKTYLNVIQDTNGVGFLDASVLASQMSVLNAAYASMGIQFNYSPTETKVVTQATWYPQLSAADADEMKSSYRRGGLHDLNIYFHNDIAGFFPGTATPPFPVGTVVNDGIIVNRNTVPGGSVTDYSAGDSLVYLTGIWLGLLQVWTGGCSEPNDGVGDTPQTGFIASGCPIGSDLCPASPGVDAINNYMIETTDACRNTFTAGQKTRAQALFDQYRIPSCGPTACCAPPPVAPPVTAPVTPPVTPPVKPPVAAPTPSPGPCFSGANSVVVQGKGVVSIESVQIGDRVKTDAASDKFSRVFSLAHVNSEHETEYLQIYTNDSDMPLEVTPDHFLHITDVKVVCARDLKVGDILAEQQIVTFIETVTRRGLYSPLTESGDILVSGVRASCFPSMLDVNPTMQAYLMHAALSMHRLACSYDFSICENESYNEDGISTYLTGMMKPLTMLMGSHILVQLLLVLVCAPFLLGSLALEKLIQSPSLLVSLIGAFILHRKFLSKNTIKAKSM